MYVERNQIILATKYEIL